MQPFLFLFSATEAAPSLSSAAAPPWMNYKSRDTIEFKHSFAKTINRLPICKHLSGIRSCVHGPQRTKCVAKASDKNCDLSLPAILSGAVGAA
jgi:hypothetical protein